MNTEKGHICFNWSNIPFSDKLHLCKARKKNLPRFNRYHRGKLAEINITTSAIFQNANEQ